jgi:hypothetical protein
MDIILFYEKNNIKGGYRDKISNRIGTEWLEDISHSSAR